MGVQDGSGHGQKLCTSIDDFCLWGSPDTNGLIGNVEAKVVAYCTKPYHGTRLIFPGAITGLQWTKTSGYIQAVGFINNTGIGLDPTDSGGELDPHGADLQGNPLGGVVYSNGTTDSDGHTLTQVFNWNTSVSGNRFCFNACYNSVCSPDYCKNIDIDLSPRTVDDDGHALFNASDSESSKSEAQLLVPAFTAIFVDTPLSPLALVRVESAILSGMNCRPLTKRLLYRS
ncbi:hypothetical protein CPB84DRAFT_1852061 [Gymnopilus junonius]|uniref:Uncharacterized protein n=1 Tax=Gymnopilus junonius TaxID=109634 RepID=A0A9P5NEY4_GYMJU|nr:hypothetical protein CPB84DRAFT_1852061 [Gymnopilus junonius]